MRKFRTLDTKAVKHTASPGTPLAWLCDEVCVLEPGEEITIDRHTLSEIPTFWHKEALFTPADRVLGNIIGSRYTHSFRLNIENGSVTFFRHENTGEARYSSPQFVPPST